jgi:hypothetical protein
MSRTWIEYLTAERRTAWGIPPERFTELTGLFEAARILLRRTGDETERTRVVTVKCRAAFKALAAEMRFFRDRYFKLPPLSEGDWAALGFRQKAPRPAPAAAPEGVPAASLSYPGGPHAVTIYLGPMAGTAEPDPRSDYGYSIYMGIMPPGGATLEQAASEKHYLMKPPADGKGLWRLRFTRRRKEKIIFDSEDAGMTVYICCRYENRKGETGQWGPVTYAIIP